VNDSTCTRHAETHRRGTRWKRAVGGALALAGLAVAGGAVAASSFADRAGDDNAAPDISSVAIVASGEQLAVRVDTASGGSLPPNAWFNLWFDLDGNPETGDAAGDDALLRYEADGALGAFRWNGTRFEEVATTGMQGRFDGGVLHLSLPLAELGPTSSPGLLVVSARSQVVGREELVASDFAPESGRLPWSSSTPATLVDPVGDHDAAPDITTVRVDDTKDGWIRFAVSLANRSSLPIRSGMALSIDVDRRLATGDAGAELSLSVFGGEALLQRWSPRARRWVLDTPPVRIRARSGSGAVVLELHRSELGDTRGFGFRLVAAETNPASSEIVALDFAPDSGVFWRHALGPAAPLRLLAGKTTGVPASPVRGRVFTIRTPVSRSDTKRGITSGSVSCDVRSGTRSVAARGRVRDGAGQCTLVVPPDATSLVGSMTVRSAGAAVTARFRFRVD
jgi:hypothetical protein